jgi:hypothetical protein
VSQRVRALVMILVCFVLLSAGDCEIGDLGEILDKPGAIVVTNGGTEPAVVAILADDVKSYPTIPGGGTASVTTNVGGAYTVNVVMSAENALEYRAELTQLRRTVEKLIDGSLSSDEKIYLFTSLAGIKSAISRFEQGQGAGCSGRIKLNRDNAETVNTIVTFRSQSGSGFWDIACGSNE